MSSFKPNTAQCKGCIWNNGKNPAKLCNYYCYTEKRREYDTVTGKCFTRETKRQKSLKIVPNGTTDA